MSRPPVLAVVMLLLPAATTAQQARLLAGRVVDAVTGLPLPAGSVAVASAGVSDRLRPDAVFVMRVPPGVVTLTIRSPGYERREVTVPAEQDAVIVELEPLAHNLDAVVVVQRTPGAPFGRSDPVSFEETLAARVAGFESMRNSGAPGDVQVRLRGVSTILGHGRPLWVLDGVVMQDAGAASGVGTVVGGSSTVPNRIADLSPFDIASVEVLRGASASAMYGSLGANGVVIVKTKRR